MIRTIRSLWNALKNYGTDEIDRLKWYFLWVGVATLIGVLPVFIFAPTLENSFYLSVPAWLFTAYRTFSLKRYARIHILGETLDLTHATETHTAAERSIFDNKTAELYRDVIRYIFLLQTLIFLGLPIYFNYTQGGRELIFIIVMVLTAIILMNFKAAKVLLVSGSVCLVIVYSIGIIMALEPRITVYTKINKASSKVMAGSSAKIINDIETLQREQKVAINNEILEATKKWTEKHPGQELPQFYQDAIEATCRGMTPDEYYREKKTEKIKAEKEERQREIELARSTPPPASAPAAQNPAPIQTAQENWQTESTHYMRPISSNPYHVTVLNPGEYRIEASINGQPTNDISYKIEGGILKPLSETLRLASSAELFVVGVPGKEYDIEIKKRG